VRIGFACLWERNPEATWSHTPWHLRAAMRRHADVADVGVSPSDLTRDALRIMHARRRDGRLVTVWQQSRITDVYCRRAIAAGVARTGADVVLEIQDLAALDAPYFILQDMSFDALLQLRAAGAPLFRPLPLETLQRRRDRQAKVYERAAGLLAMSQWLARSLIEVSGVPADKVHVVHGGISARYSGELPRMRQRPRHRLLFVGRDFIRKGGDLVVDAVRTLRRDVDPNITLTVAGPPVWPLAGEVPDGVDFLGPRPLAEVGHLLDTHDLFVMPSRLEPFGIVFAEAISRGLPCVGRDAFAMPEIISPGRTGALVSTEDRDELVDVVAKALSDDELYAACHAEAGRAAELFSWDRAARQAIAAITTGRRQELA
jgi:glycosyltransferase involved in cell wall biosynthesis